MTAHLQERGRRHFVGNLLIPLLLLAIMAVFFFETLDYPTFEDVGPAAAPHLWMVFIAVFCLFLAAQATLRKGAADPAAGRIGSVLLALVWMAGYLAAIQAIGYFVSTSVFLVGAMLGLNYRNPLVIAAVTIGWLVFSYIVFYSMLYIPLPVGPLLAPFID